MLLVNARWDSIRSLVVIGMVLCGVGSSKLTAQTRVRVQVPFVRVNTGPDGTSVRAPFTRIERRKFDFPYDQPIQITARPLPESYLHVEFSSKLKSVIPATGYPAPLANPRRENAADKRVSTKTIRRRAIKAPPIEGAPAADKRPENTLPSSYVILPTPSREFVKSVKTSVYKFRAAATSSERVLQKAKIPPVVSPLPKTGQKPKPLPNLDRPIRRAGNTQLMIVVPFAVPTLVSNSNAKVPASTHAIDLIPMWHSEIPSVFLATEGVHVFAVIHPKSFKTVSVKVNLPNGRPQLKIKSDEIEFDYGKLEVKVRFRSSGRVEIKYDD